MTPGVLIHNTSFPLQLMNGHNMLKFYITIDQKGLIVTDATAYWAHS
jgi:hypothetical protein